MKLNLLPPSASPGGGSILAYVVGIVIIAVSVYFSFSMKSAGEQALSTANVDVSANQTESQKTIDLAASADPIIAQSAGPLLNVNLAESMMRHNSVYPAFYDQVKSYIPNYFRIVSLQATPNDATTCTVTMQGTVGSFEQYADLMLALSRWKSVTSVSRSGYQLNDVYVPPLAQDDQTGRPIKQGQQRLTDDPIQRLDTKIAEAGETDYVGTGGFGNPTLPRQIGAAPSESMITVVAVVNKDLRTPNPRATLAGAGSAFANAAPPAAAGGTAGGG